MVSYKDFQDGPGMGALLRKIVSTPGYRNSDGFILTVLFVASENMVSASSMACLQRLKPVKPP